MQHKDISQAALSRLPRYLRYLAELKDQGIERISSKDFSELMHVSASQIRQDFNRFGEFGQQGYGYNVDFLYTEIGKILGLNEKHHLILIGAGHLGQALVNYMNFEKRGFIFKGIFDNNPALYGSTIRDIPVRPMGEISEFVKENEIDIAVLTVPKHSAVEIADELVAYGIKGIWNFAHVDLKVPKDVKVENVHLSDSLMKLSYNLSDYSE